jgi:uncharacterized protein YidB (DUF937 family)
MGLLDDVLGHVTSKLGPAASTAHPDLVGSLVQMLGSGGGLGALVQQFEQAGLGKMMQSWIATGPNPPISPAQLQQVLGSGQLQALAAKLGLSPEAVTSQIAHVLPHVVDGMTPNGTLPAGGDMLGGAMDMLKKFI